MNAPLGQIGLFFALSVQFFHSPFANAAIEWEKTGEEEGVVSIDVHGYSLNNDGRVIFGLWD